MKKQQLIFEVQLGTLAQTELFKLSGVFTKVYISNQIRCLVSDLYPLNHI